MSAPLRYAEGRSSLGAVGIVASERGVHAIEVGDDEAAVRASLLARYPDAAAAGDDTTIAAWLAAVIAAVESTDAAVTPAVGVPLDQAGSAFQRSVWAVLGDIPTGSTRSYTEVAAAIGRPTAARAVARACATNEVAVLVPCHRVVRGDGSLGGYRWGIERKRAMLERERQATRDIP